MLKGVNRQVVEVAETGSDYFEKALFFVNPKYYGLTDGKLREKAQTLTANAGMPPIGKTKPKKNRLAMILTIAASAAAGAIAAAIGCIIIM
ncbi:MAG: hypothetical protein LUG85_02860 [Clostridiales bacterium]|nr:hypothetical protein [Clostridiales bacterium]